METEYKKEDNNKSKGHKFKVYCIKCKGKTNHLVEQSFDCNGGDPREGVFWEEHFQIIRCEGCEEISFRQTFWSTDSPEVGEDGSSEPSVKLYPKRSDKIRANKTYYYAPNKLRRVYRETIECFNNEQTTLCAVGLRAIVEGICADKGISDGPVQKKKTDGTIKTERSRMLEGKIAGLAEKGILTSKHANILHEHRFMGNEAVHELEAPSLAELTHAIEIIEHTLDALYEMPDKAEALRNMKSRRVTIKHKKIKK